jgi:membrane-associated protease RseP (regulator of RpoE activity)
MGAKAVAGPTATPTPGLQAGDAYLQIDVTKVDPQATTLQMGAAQSVSVDELAQPALLIDRQAAEARTQVAVPAHGVVTVDVEVIAFVDEEGAHSATYDPEETTRILIRLSSARVGDVARGLAGAFQQGVWLVSIRR